MHASTFNFTVELQYDDNFEVGKQHEFNCTVNATGVDVNNISWIGPNGVITNDSSNRISVISDVSNYTSTYTLKFLYFTERDEDILYNCTATLSLPGKNHLLSKPFNIRNLIGM